MGRRTDRFGMIEAGRAEADQIGAIRRRGRMPPENRRPARWTEIPHPVIRGCEAGWAARGDFEGMSGSVCPNDQGRPGKSPADRAVTVASVKDLGRLEPH